MIVIGPQKYNELYLKIKNLNRLLAWGHAKALETLLERVSCERAISDQFGDERLILNALQEKGRRIVLEQRTKAESDLAVAAASIVARAERKDINTLTTELNARQSLAAARRAMLGSMVNYNIAIADLERAKGTLLQFHNVIIPEMEEDSMAPVPLP